MQRGWGHGHVNPYDFLYVSDNVGNGTRWRHRVVTMED